jgi:hypothetical protein
VAPIFCLSVVFGLPFSIYSLEPFVQFQAGYPAAVETSKITAFFAFDFDGEANVRSLNESGWNETVWCLL